MSTPTTPNPSPNPHPNPIQTQSVADTVSRRQFWLVLIGMILLAANMRSPIVALGSLVNVIQEALNISAVEVGWLGSVPMVLFAFGALVSPKLAKRFGLGNLLLLSIVFMTVGILWRVFWVGWWPFLFGTVLLSFAISIANTLAAPAIKQLTPRHIPLVTGIFSTSMSVMAGVAAGVVLPIEQWLGWRWALGSWAVLGIMACLLWLPIRSRLADKTASSMTANATASSSFAMSNLPNIRMWQTPLAWQIAAFMGLQSLLFYTVASFLPTIWVSKGLDPITAGNMGMVYQVMAPLATLALTVFMGRRRWVRPLAMFAALINVVGTAGLAFASPSLAWLWTACMGLGGAMIFTMCIMMIGMRTYDTEQASNLSGMAQTVGYGIAIIGPLGMGSLHEYLGSWHVPLIILFVLMVFNVFMGWLATRPVMIDGSHL